MSAVSERAIELCTALHSDAHRCNSCDMTESSSMSARAKACDASCAIAARLPACHLLALAELRRLLDAFTLHNFEAHYSFSRKREPMCSSRETRGQSNGRERMRSWKSKRKSSSGHMVSSLCLARTASVSGAYCERFAHLFGALFACAWFLQSNLFQA